MISQITLTGHTRDKQIMREALASSAEPNPRLAMFENDIRKWLSSITLSEIDRRVKHGHNLSFEEAFVGTCYALMATDVRFWDTFHGYAEVAYGGRPVGQDKALACGTAFLQLMAVKESLATLSPDEVAGIAAATTLNTVINPNLGRVIETCGMGGDIGLSVNHHRAKTINCSTLTAIVLKSLGLSVMKHGSYSNTSAVGSTDSAETLGLRTGFSSKDDLQKYWDQYRFCYLDAHLVKTVHDLSHLLMMETINHLSGPMSCPLHPEATLDKIMGVNEKVHPEVVAKAYGLLHKMGFQKMGAYAIVCGLDQAGCDILPSDYGLVHQHTVLDELSPYASIVSFGNGDRFLGTWVLTPQDFGIEIESKSIVVENNKEAIDKANLEALSGSNRDLAAYLAMNAALALFTVTECRSIVPGTLPYWEPLRKCFDRCYEAIATGEAMRTLDALSMDCQSESVDT